MSRARYALVQAVFFAVFVSVLLFGAAKRNVRALARRVALALGRRCAFCQGPRVRSYGLRGGDRFCATCAPALGLR